MDRTSNVLDTEKKSIPLQETDESHPDLLPSLIPFIRIFENLGPEFDCLRSDIWSEATDTSECATPGIVNNEIRRILES